MEMVSVPGASAHANAGIVPLVHQIGMFFIKSFISALEFDLKQKVHWSYFMSVC